MSIIAAMVQSDGSVMIAADTQLTEGTRIRRMRKLWFADHVAVGTAGTGADSLALGEWFMAHSLPSLNPPDLINFMRAFYRERRGNDDAWTPENDVLFAGFGTVARVTPDLCVSYAECDAIGSPQDIALGAMRLGANPRQAVEVCCEMDAWCSAPVDAMTIR